MHTTHIADATFWHIPEPEDKDDTWLDDPDPDDDDDEETDFDDGEA